MRDEDKIKEQLINKLKQYRQGITELKRSETELKQSGEALRESEKRYSASRSGIGKDFYDRRPATIGDRAIVKMDVRIDSNQTEEMVYKDIQNVLDKLQAEDPQLKTKLERDPIYINRPFYELPMDSYIVQVLERAHKHVFGGDELKRQPSTGGADAAFMLTKAKIPTVVYGMGGASQHDPSWAVDTHDLYINVDELPTLAKIHALCCLAVHNTQKK